jgi:hypothetical protein
MPPAQLPNVATITHVQAFIPLKIITEKTISELNGNIVAAKNAARKSPKYPRLIRLIIGEMVGDRYWGTQVAKVLFL